jgi:hypothetical protein
MRCAVLLVITSALACTPAGDTAVSPARQVTIDEATYRALPSLSLEPDGLLCPSGEAHCLLGPQGRAVHGPGGTVLLWDFGGPIRLVAAGGSDQGQVGRIGEGPGEYRVVLAAGLSPAAVIDVLDGALQRRVQYGDDGTPLATARSPLPPGFITAEFVGGELRAVTTDLGSQRNDAATAPVVLVALDTGTPAPRSLRTLPVEQQAFGLADMRPPPGLFEPQERWAMAPDGRTAHTKADRFVVDIFQLDASKDLRLSVDAAPRRVASAEVTSEVDRRLRGIGNPRMRSAIEAQAGRAPEYHPAITGLRLLGNGQLWVRETPDESGAQVRWIVFDEEGTALGTVSVPAEVTILLAQGDRILINDPGAPGEAGGLQWVRLKGR